MKKSKLTRRAFLGTAAAATIATQMKFAGAQDAAKTHADAEEAAEMGCLFTYCGQ
jgi:nitrous oxide reductase